MRDEANAPRPDAAPVRPGPARTGLAWLRRALLWLPGTLLGALAAGLLVFGAWAASEGSLAQALRWAHDWQATEAPETGTIALGEVRGSLLAGGTIESLSWSREGLTVQATSADLRLGMGFWLGLPAARVDIERLHLARLQIDDRRAPSTSAPGELPTAIELPVAVDIPLGIDSLRLSGSRPMAATAVQAHYHYGRAQSDPDVSEAHVLTVNALQWADGRYQAQLTLGAQAPMPLRLQASGDLSATVPEGDTLRLRARITARGRLGGDAPTIELGAQIEPVGRATATPTLAGTARLLPRARQPLAEAELRLHRLDLAMLWPEAPRTALTGTLSARPSGTQWGASLQLHNERAGPLDRQRVPLQSLSLALTQDGDLWRVPSLQANVGGGTLQGQGQARLPADTGSATPWGALGAWQGELRLAGIDPGELWSTLAPAALDGSVSARALDPAGRQPGLQIDARVSPAGRQPRRSAADALRLREVVLQGRWLPAGGSATLGRLQLDRARLDALEGRLDASGSLDTTTTVLDGRLSLAVPGLQASLEGQAAARTGGGSLDIGLADAGRLAAWLRGLRNAPLIGEPLRRLLAPVDTLQIQARGDARLRWQGGLAALGWPGPAAEPPRLDLQLHLAHLHLQRTGEDAPLDLVLGDTTLGLQGPPSALALRLRTQATQAGWRAALDTAGAIALPGTPPDGQRGDMRLERVAIDLQRADADADATRWTLTHTAPWQLRWQQRPEGLQVSLAAGGLRVLPQRAGVRAEPMTLDWEALEWHAGALNTQGRLAGLPLAWVDLLARADNPADTPGPLARAGLGGDMRFDGRWDIALPARADQPPRLNLVLEQRTGDLAVQTDGAFDDNASRGQRIQAGVKTARLQVDTDGPQVRATLRWDSEQFGQANAEASTRLFPPDGAHKGWHWPASAPIDARLRASLPQVGVWSVLAPPGWRVRGALQLDARVAGTRADPQFSGSLQADDLALRSLVNGIVFRGGELRASLAGERIVIERFRLEGRGGAERGGVLSATGSAEWRRVTRDGVVQREPLIELNARAEKLRASSRPDRRLTVSGELRARLEGPALQLRGKLRADEALIVLPDELAPALGEDVVVRGTEYPIERGSAVRVVPDVQVTLDLGDSFELRGQGLQTRLSGQLEVRSVPTAATPRVVGEVRTASGSYRAYGQQLRIETGVLRFNGPYDNPALDIVAVRPGSATQRVGVQVSGTAQAPRVRLFSDPDMPDSDKLAWLVLGRPASGRGAEAAVLQQAAIALLAGNDGGPFDGGLAGALGLDALSLATDGTNADGSSNTALTLGKRLADDLYISYERSLAGTLNTVSMFYDVTRSLTVRARAGSENAIDLIFTFRYD